MRRLLLALAIALLAAPATAEAHPLGNLSVNHLATVSVSEDRVDVTWLVDQAEVPTFQERGLAPSAVLARKRSEARRGLKLRVDGRIVALRPVGPGRISFPAGSGGLKTTRVELELSAPARGARQVRLEDATFPGRVGWRAVVVRAGEGTAVRSSVPASDPTGGLRRYPEGALSAPADTRVATLRVAPGDGTVSAPGAKVVEGGGSDGFAGLLDGDRVLVLLLLAAFAWGAVHALSPGHGKAMVAAYLVGTRGTPRDAVALGAIVTVTHTIGVFALGVVTLALSAFVLPEDLYPWLNLASGLLVLGVGAALVRARYLKGSVPHIPHEHHHHHHHGDHHHDHDHDLGRRGLLAMGASAGLIPCPSALVVLLGAIAQHEIGLGLVLIVAFSLGLASTLTGLGLAVVHAGRGLARLNVPARVITTLPAASAALVAVVGVVLTIQSIGMIR